MRVLVAIGCTLLSAGVAFAQPADRGRGIVNVIEEDVNGAAPSEGGVVVTRRAEGADAASGETAGTGTATRPAANGLARSLLDGGLHRMAIENLEGAIRRGDADAETHHLLAEAKRAEARGLRAAADAAAARGDAAGAALLRRDAETVEREALEAARRGADHTARVMEERLAAGDTAGAASAAEVLRQVDPNNARAGEVLARTGASTPRATTWDSGAAASSGAEAASPGGNANARSVWDRYGSDPNSAWDRAVAAANRAPTPVASNAGASSTPASSTTTPASTTTTPTPSTTTTPELPPLDEDAATTPAATTTDRLGRPMQVSQRDLEVLARIVKGEALVCSFEGKVAVAAVVLNRVRDRRWPNTIPGVAHQPLQFSCYNRNYRAQLYDGPIPEECFRAARAALAGQDPTNGATHYYNPYLVTPDWARRLTPTRRIGTNANDTHVFFR